MPKRNKLYIAVNFRVHLKKPLKTRHELTEKVNVMQTGGVSFLINGANIPFKFRWHVESYRIGENVAVLSCNSSGSVRWWMYRQIYKKNGLKKKDITLELLSSAEGIECFNIQMETDTDWENEIVSVEASLVELSDGKGYHRFPEKVIEEYKCKIKQISSNKYHL